MEKALPRPVAGTPFRLTGTRGFPTRRTLLGLIPAIACFLGIWYGFAFGQGIKFWEAYTTNRLSPQAAAAVSRCAHLHDKPGPPPNFSKRTQSDRYVPGTKPVLLKNAKIWSGEKNGTEVLYADVLLDKGIIKGIGRTSLKLVKGLKEEYEVIDARNAWVTPGIVDLHSHLGTSPSPGLAGAEDDNSIHGITQPWLRAVDGLHTSDDAYELSIAGGVTSALVLPGSLNAIGGQGITIKLRKTAERSPTAMLLEAPYHLNTSFPKPDGPLRWRQMKHACGENPSSYYGNTRMDTVWAFRKAYDTARQIKLQQDAYCAKVEAGKFNEITDKPYPEDLQWEALVDVLRGRVKVQVHCYEAVDLDDIVRLSNEFQFSIAAFHHAHEAYLVPDVLKRAYGRPPAVAMFASLFKYKREAYRGSEFAPRILAEHGLSVVLKSDHPVTDSRYLLYQAQQAYLYGLPESLAIASVTSTPASIVGMDHRIGYVREGYDADLVIWDSHPLALGATPKQVFIDGIPQLKKAYVTHKPDVFQHTPDVPNYDKEAKAAVEYEGLPPLKPKAAKTGTVLFTNVRSIFIRTEDSVQESFTGQDTKLGVVIVKNGKVLCSGTQLACDVASLAGDAEIVDLKGGSIAPGLTTFGTALGLVEITQELSTQDGFVFDPLTQKVPSILGGDTALVRAVDGLQFGTRDALTAYHDGVTTAITAPVGAGFYAGLSTTFTTGVLNKLDDEAIVQDVNAVHVTIRHFGTGPSISTQVGTLRRLLLNPPQGQAGEYFQGIVDGRVTLVVNTDSADIIATLVLLKKEVESLKGNSISLTVAGGLEAHLVAKELGEAGVGVVQLPARPFPTTWERRRILPGHPLVEQNSVETLLKHNVTVGVGVEDEISQVRNTRFDIAWLALDAGGSISKAQAIALGSTNVDKLLGGKAKAAEEYDLVATEGGDLLDFSSKVKAVISLKRGLVDLL
ncbi:carbohydrate esterase family 9 protein [Irpex rosettiformis]|uniref:Carbohydrate esterase family 9 protein n=1 Tax=Irpex rosettiformis TaxID=378272 RepID=A0ACB8TT83_9APHY|nr:carbohydrate esterase family 9 protein [Irpex rosettiformis]